MGWAVFMNDLLPDSLQLFLITAAVPARPLSREAWQKGEHMLGGWGSWQKLSLSVSCFIRVHVAMYIKQVPR